MAKKNTPVKKAAAKVENKVKPIPYKKPAKVKFVSFSFGATIPTQSFGNVTPRIEVQADTYEAALKFVTPKIEELYAKYAEVKPAFLGKITETTVNVNVPVPKAEEKAPVSSPTSTEASVPSTQPATETKSKSDAVLKAEKAIGLAMTADATRAIEEQIMKSVKIAVEDKPALYELVLKKRKELK